MDAKKCDRCGKLYELKKPPVPELERLAGNLKRISCLEKSEDDVFLAMASGVDLCIECETSLKEWIAEPNRTEKGMEIESN